MRRLHKLCLGKVALCYLYTLWLCAGMQHHPRQFAVLEPEIIQLTAGDGEIIEHAFFKGDIHDSGIVYDSAGAATFDEL